MGTREAAIAETNSQIDLIGSGVDRREKVVSISSTDSARVVRRTLD